jgi:hypothetical protein
MQARSRVPFERAHTARRHPGRQSDATALRTSFVRELPAWFAPSVTTVPAEGPPAEWFDQPPPRHPPRGPGAIHDGILVLAPLWFRTRVVVRGFVPVTCTRFGARRQVESAESSPAGGYAARIREPLPSRCAQVIAARAREPSQPRQAANRD